MHKDVHSLSTGFAKHIESYQCCTKPVRFGVGEGLVSSKQDRSSKLLSSTPPHDVA
jgi:hypothetical protein